MRRALLGTALTAIALLVIAEPANAAPAAPAHLGSPTITTNRDAGAIWSTDLIKTSTGFKQKYWDVSFDISSIPATSLLSVSSCVDYFDGHNNLTKETCTSGQVAHFTHAFDVADLSHASVSASGIPTQTCSTDANFQLIGQCKPAAPISVKATWTGQGPITFSTFTQYIPGVYRLVQRSKDRDADASATFNRKLPPGPLVFAHISTTTTKEWGNPCGPASGGVVPNGC
jgi:hypothetical protein